MVTEIDIVWRGIPLSSYYFSASGVDKDLAVEQKKLLANKTVNAFFEKTSRENVFSASFLFEKLKASDYNKELKLPNSIDSFYLEDMQLYRDPFQGAVARYSHPEYEREVLDVFVYPIFEQSALVMNGSTAHQNSDTGNDNSEAQDSLLNNELSKDIDDIKVIAKSRNISEVAISDIKRIAWQHENKRYQGYYFDVLAEDDEGEPMFSTTYLFQSKDKFIKFSANFPDRIAQSMVKNALPKIEVPEPSELMQSLRDTNG
jgi:hypothetical protein